MFCVQLSVGWCHAQRFHKFHASCSVFDLFIEYVGVNVSDVCYYCIECAILEACVTPVTMPEPGVWSIGLEQQVGVTNNN